MHNGSAGSAQETDELYRAFEDAKLSAEVWPVTAGSCSELARDAAQRADVVVAAGGDGTVSSVAGALAGTGVPLGVLPLGTLNHFARDLEIPLDLTAAVGVVAGGTVRTVDVADVNGHVFINNSSVGFYPRLVQRRDGSRRLLGKTAATAWSALKVLFRLPRVRLWLRTEDREASFVTPILFVGNNRYDPRLLADRRRERLDGGELSAHVAETARPLGFLWLALRWVLGRGRSEDVTSFSSRSFRVESLRRTLAVAADGEVLRLRTPLRYAIHPGALRVLVPAG